MKYSFLYEKNLRKKFLLIYFSFFLFQKGIFTIYFLCPFCCVCNKHYFCSKLFFIVVSYDKRFF